MIPTLIVLGLLALGVGIVAFATRRPATRQDVIVDQDTAWNDPITPANAASVDDAAPVEDDPFAHAPTLVAEPAPASPFPTERAS
jgi:hypothetical protein